VEIEAVELAPACHDSSEILAERTSITNLFKCPGLRQLV